MIRRMSDLEVDFVLVRGPTKINRRLHVTVPADSTPVIIGRGLHCATVLDPWLVFASQVQCSLFCLPDPVPPEQNQDNKQENTANKPSLPFDKTPSLQSRLPTLYILDMCSSNGTFVNNIRIGSTDAVVLKDGDSCIFGGMRDVAVGEALPPDAFDRPELSIWKVDILNGKDSVTEHEYQPTPTLVPSCARPHHSEPSISKTVLCTLREKHLNSISRSTKTPVERAGCGQGSVEVTPTANVTQRLFETPETEAKQWGGRSDQLFIDGTNCGERISIAEVDGEIMKGLTEPEPNTRILVPKKDDVPANNSVCFSNNSASHTIHEGSYPHDQAILHENIINPDPHISSNPGAERDGSVTFVKPHNDSSHTSLLFLEPPSLEPGSTPMIAQPVCPPAAAYLRAVLLGRHTFRVPEENFSVTPSFDKMENIETSGVGNKMNRDDCARTMRDLEQTDVMEMTQSIKESPRRFDEDLAEDRVKRTKIDRAHSSETLTTEVTLPFLSLPSPFIMEFTQTHWKWRMDNPNRAYQPTGSSEIDVGNFSDWFQCILPLSSIDAFFACKERMGIAIKLKENCQVPLIRPEVLGNALDHRWILWEVHSFVMPNFSPSVKETTKGKNSKKSKSKRANGAESLTMPKVDPLRFIGSVNPETQELSFKSWVDQIERFYASCKIAPLQVMEATTFDEIFMSQTF